MWTCQGVTTFREFWARPAYFGQNGGWDESLGVQVCFCLVNHVNFATADFHQIWSQNVFQFPVAESGKSLKENFQFTGHLPPKSEIENRSNRHLTQSRLQVTGCTAERYGLLHVVVQGPLSFRYSSTFLYDVLVRRYGASKLPNFRILAYFPHTKPLKCIFQWPTNSPGVTSQNASDFPCDIRSSKGVLSGSGVFLQFLVGELGTPKLAQSFAYGKWLYPHRMQLHSASDPDQKCLKMRNSEDGCTFPPNIFAPTPKITPLPFNAKPIIQIDLHKSLMELQRWNFTGIWV